MIVIMEGFERSTHRRPSKAEAALNTPAPTLIALGLFGVMLGLAIAISGKAAWGAADYTEALKVPGAPQSWGWALVCGGAAIVGGKLFSHRNRITLLAGLFFCGAWHLMFGASFVTEYIHTGSYGLLLAVTHLWLSFMYIYKFSVYRNLALHLM